MNPEERLPLNIRWMEPGDVDAAMRLRAAAGWNQCPNDWLGFMSLEPKGCFVAETGGSVIATATTINYAGRFGWIGMILVDPALRRRGIATQMMDCCIRYLEADGCPCQKLDATDAGATVYEKIGFQVEYQVERWVREPSALSVRTPEAVYPFRPADVDSVAKMDEQAFGADRKRLLRWYAEHTSTGFQVRDGNEVRGFMLGRSGSAAYQVGPSVADTPETARQLLAAAVSRVSNQRIIVDIPMANIEAASVIREFGFTPSRVLKRMHRGGNPFPGNPDRVFCLSAFEFG